MSNLYVALFNHCVLQGRIYSPVPQELLQLLDGHTFVNCYCCQSSSEFMRVHLGDTKLPSVLTKTNLYATDLQALMGLLQGYKQCRVIVSSAIQVVLQVYLRSGIEVYNPFLITFTEYNTFSLVIVDIGTVEQDHFSYTHPGGGQQVYHCQKKI